MRLNLQSDYALRLLMYLATNEDRLCTIAEVADRYSVSRNHLVKVAHLLGTHEFIRTVRGRGGGIALARPPSQINLGQVLRCTENDFHLVECFRDNAQCIIENTCKLPKLLEEATRAFLGVLDAYVLSDLLRRNRGLHTILRAELRP